ncbi:MAG: hypothetical protein ACP5PX_06680 [Candidatus Hadarchaeum sp.]|uniref:hypothetical protein n=1 Tax=Candidatus Hadarchaeum sp. TaxID=2883567 RepID=UPI003D10972F
MIKDTRGIESLPVIIMIGAMLAVSSVSIGIDVINRTQRMIDRQRAINSFNLLVEQSQILCAGGVGNSKIVELQLGDGIIILKGNLVQLLSGDSIRTELLPLPISADENELRSGFYLLMICQGVDGRFFIKIEGI